jgi:hypothetical protein
LPCLLSGCTMMLLLPQQKQLQQMPPVRTSGGCLAKYTHEQHVSPSRSVLRREVSWIDQIKSSDVAWITQFRNARLRSFSADVACAGSRTHVQVRDRTPSSSPAQLHCVVDSHAHIHPADSPAHSPVCRLPGAGCSRLFCRLPGRFRNTHLQPDQTAAALNAARCPMAFPLDGAKYNLSALQVDVGGYIANNGVDDFSYCINVCGPVTSERNCICYACGGKEYPASQVFKDPSKGETCQQYLGQLAASSWKLLEAGHPAGGLVLTYGMGQGSDSTEINFHCDKSTDGACLPPPPSPPLLFSVSAAEV